ncbi:dihydrolipoamide acetyltransferase family protein [Alicyclobacillus pomorum]|uniref:dihydrolipoamide acetyltransferase family protein n=1 Tax=Alicyclobacillus pomorum TaxID=204470 RepID=UPI000419D8DB|nr:dihydrolipoamide acetyltransferase family protein [Alicyclobacillus pomorum]
MPDVKMPQLGESVTEGTIGKWLKNVGDKVSKYEPLVEVMTDKVNAEVPSDFEGTLTEILVQEGETVKVGTVLCRIAEAGEQSDAQSANAAAPSAHPTEPQTPSAPRPASARSRFSPAVLRLAEEHNIDLSTISGTGEGGRITRKDVLAAIEAGKHGTSEPAEGTPASVSASASAQNDRAAAPAASRGEAAPPSVHTEAGQSSEDVEVLEPSPIRKTIARRMVESKHNAPHAWTMVEADVSELVAFRQRVKADFKRKEGVDLTYLPFFIKAVVEALKQYPMLNASWVDDKIHVHKRINISIAVATDDALVVPVIHNADRLSIAGLAHAVNELAAKARSGRLSLQDVQGGTFTVNNTGAFGSILSQPIINAPQAAILSVESIVKRAVVVNDAIAVRSMVNLCLSLDHRLLDGWVAGQFLKAVKERLQSFGNDTVLF